MSLVKSKWHGKGKGIRRETPHTFQQKNNQILPWRCAYQKACISCGPLSHGLPRKNGKNPPMQEKSRRFSGAGAMQEKWSKTRRLLRNAGDLTGLVGLQHCVNYINITHSRPTALCTVQLVTTQTREICLSV